MNRRSGGLNVGQLAQRLNHLARNAIASKANACSGAGGARANAKPSEGLEPSTVGQPDRRHQLAGGQLGQHPGVDPVGLVLHASGASPFTLSASAISTSQPRSWSWSWTKRAPFIDSIAARIGAP